MEREEKSMMSSNGSGVVRSFVVARGWLFVWTDFWLLAACCMVPFRTGYIGKRLFVPHVSSFFNETMLVSVPF